MFDFLTETMLAEYFTVRALFGEFLTEKERLFKALSRIYFVDEKEAERLYALAESSEAREVRSEQSYYRYLRVKEYAEMEGMPPMFGEELDELVGIKGGAFVRLEGLEILTGAVSSRSEACRKLTQGASVGIVLCLRALGVLQCEGILFDRDEAAGRENLSKAARWNSAEGLFAALYYDKDHTAEYLGSLVYNLKKAAHPEAIAAAEAVYGVAPVSEPEACVLLEKAFGTGLLKRELYVGKYARILFTEVLGKHDKEQVLFSGNKELLAEAGDLPLKLSADKPVPLAQDALSRMPLGRTEEQEKIVKALQNADLRAHPGYRPLCLSAESDALLELYENALKEALAGAHIETLEISDLTEYDLEPTKNNIYVRSCNEDRANVYFLFFREEISEREYDLAKNFLLSERRAKFRLNRPGVSLDLGAVLPVVFCDKENARILRQYCEVIRLAPISRTEKAAYIRGVLRMKGEEYGVKEISIEDAAVDRLALCSPENIREILDRAVRDNRGEQAVIDETALKAYLRTPGGHTSFGFGGNNEND